MDIPLCQLVILMGYILHYRECRSHDQQYSSDSVHPVSCSGTLSQLTGRKLIFLSDERKLSLIIKDDGSGSYVCLLIDDDSKLTESKTNGRVAQVVSALSCSKDEFIDVIRQCHDPTGSLQGRVYGHHVLKRSIVYPDTVWCGAGNTAKGNTTKLGKYPDTDSCCRNHDLCTPYIAGLSYDSTSRLFNWSPFTRLHCHCDVEFKACLKRSTDSIAKTIGNLYFNLLSSYCFDQVSRCPDNGTSASCMSWKWVSAGRF
ncbi:uncharacterized protein LOC112577052 isoform X2 [Pomacea canaliculata]|nr:uncharacterized protein LOC112577052 isoform X2 [Pomacea canaliculata]